MRDSDWRILAELYKNPNMTKVATLLYMTQPALTKRLRAMEEEFGIVLADRTPKGLEFTAEGDYLAKQAQVYLRFLEETYRELERIRENTDNVITVGAFYTYGKFKLSDLMLSYRAQHPNVQFNVVTQSSDELLQLMLSGAIDAGFIRGNYDGPVNKVYAGENPAYLFTREPVLIEELRDMPRIAYSINPQNQRVLDGWFTEQFGREAPANMTVGYMDTAWDMVSRGVGYTCGFLPDCFEQVKNLCMTPMNHTDGTPVSIKTWFIYPKNKRLPQLQEDFIRFVERQMKEKEQSLHTKGTA